MSPPALATEPGIYGLEHREETLIKPIQHTNRSHIRSNLLKSYDFAESANPHLKIPCPFVNILLF